MSTTCKERGQLLAMVWKSYVRLLDRKLEVLAGRNLESIQQHFTDVLKYHLTEGVEKARVTGL